MAESPSLLLQRAAEHLEALAAAATPPVWSTKDLSGFGHEGVWWVEAETEDMFTCVAELETVNPKADAAWIAAMSPVVAQPLANILRDAAFSLDAHPEYRTHYLSYIALAEAVLGTEKEQPA